MRAARLSTSLTALALVAGCGPERPPPSRQSFDGLPISGSLADAKAAGFTRCYGFNTTMRCRREGVMLAGHGPYNAAVDLVGGDGSGGFDHLTLWHDTDQMAVQDAGDALEEQHGWSVCFTGEGQRGDQEIYTRAGASARVSIDLSYWGKRRLRVIPEWNPQKPLC